MFVSEQEQNPVSVFQHPLKPSQKSAKQQRENNIHIKANDFEFKAIVHPNI